MSYIPNRCNECRQARTIASISLGLGMLLWAMTSHADDPDFLIDGLSRPIPDYFDIFCLHPDDDRDVDEDMLNDDFENNLARSFAPVMLFDSAENTVQGGSINEPHIVYQVTPLSAGNNVYPGGFIVWIQYQFLFSDDGGWVHCGTDGDDHKGDHYCPKQLFS